MSPRVRRLLAAAGLLAALLGGLALWRRSPVAPRAAGVGAPASAERGKRRAPPVRLRLDPAAAAEEQEDGAESAEGADEEVAVGPPQPLAEVLLRFRDAVCACPDWACVTDRAAEFNPELMRTQPAADRRVEEGRLRTELVACQERLYTPIRERKLAERMAERARELEALAARP